LQKKEGTELLIEPREGLSQGRNNRKRQEIRTKRGSVRKAKVGRNAGHWLGSMDARPVHAKQKKRGQIRETYSPSAHQCPGQNKKKNATKTNAKSRRLEKRAF